MDKREAILKAAMELFAERGFYGTPVPLIAERAQVGAGTIYRYFKDKEALVNELFRLAKTSVFEAVTQDPDETEPLRTIFDREVRQWIEFALENQQLYQFLEEHYHAPYLDAESNALCDLIHAQALVLLERGQRERVLRGDVPPVVLLAVLEGIIDGVLTAHFAQDLALSPEVIDSVEEMAWQAVRA